MFRSYKTVIILVFSLITLIVYGKSPKVIKLGGKDGWGYLYHNNTDYYTGLDGTKSIILKDDAYTFNPGVDLLIHFDGKASKLWHEGSSININRNYSVRKKKFLFDSKNKVYGKSAAKFLHNKSTINLRAKAGSWFNKTSNAGSFTIEFWLNPSTLSDGQVILKKYGPVIVNGLVDKYSGIICKIKNRRLSWEFHNIFHSPYYFKTNNQTEKNLVKITSYSNLKRHNWMHHALTFDVVTGKMVYYINGKAQKTIFVTTSGQPDDTILTPKFYSEEKSLLVIGERFYGFIDEFMIYTDYKVPHPIIIRYSDQYKDKKYFKVKKYSSLEGVITSGIFDHKMTGSYLKRIKVNSTKPGGGQITFLYRMSDRYFSASDSLIKWHEIDPNNFSFKINKTPKGRFFQWKAVLKSSYDREHSPIIKNISFYFEIDISPSAPKDIIAYSSGGKVFLKWAGNIESDIKEYRIYYGTYKGVYLGKGNSIDTKPLSIGINQLVDIVNPVYVISNLPINGIYFFVITAVDKYGHESVPSNEVSIRVK